jgi:ribose transport system substrate-binding protein
VLTAKTQYNLTNADMQWLEPYARSEMESALSRFDKIDLVFAHNDPGAHGAYLAAKATDREQQMKLVGIDALPQEGVAYVKQGILDATFQYPTGGAEAIATALKIFNGENVPKEIGLNTRLFDKDNVVQGGVTSPVVVMSWRLEAPPPAASTSKRNQQLDENPQIQSSLPGRCSTFRAPPATLFNRRLHPALRWRPLASLAAASQPVPERFCPVAKTAQLSIGGR